MRWMKIQNKILCSLCCLLSETLSKYKIWWKSVKRCKSWDLEVVWRSFLGGWRPKIKFYVAYVASVLKLYPCTKSGENRCRDVKVEFWRSCRIYIFSWKEVQNKIICSLCCSFLEPHPCIIKIGQEMLKLSFGGHGGGPIWGEWRSKIKIYIVYVTPFMKLYPCVKFGENRSRDVN